jgi:hypothetical protein
MKLFTGPIISAALVLTVASANAQGMAPGEMGRPDAVPGIRGPYAAVPPDAPMPGYGPVLLPPREVYTVLRESGFRPLGPPRLRGFFYSIAVTDRRGGDGRLVIDARDGQIVRFMPAYRMGESYGANAPYPPSGRVPWPGDWSDAPRPPESVPRLAGRTPAVPIPRAAPPRPAEDQAQAQKPQPPQQSAAVQARQVETAVTPSPPAVEAKPAEVKPAEPQILPTRPMPEVQGLD